MNPFNLNYASDIKLKNYETRTYEKNDYRMGNYKNYYYQNCYYQNGSKKAENVKTFKSALIDNL